MKYKQWFLEKKNKKITHSPFKTSKLNFVSAVESWLDQKRCRVNRSKRRQRRSARNLQPSLVIPTLQRQNMPRNIWLLISDYYERLFTVFKLQRFTRGSFWFAFFVVVFYCTLKVMFYDIRQINVYFIFGRWMFPGCCHPPLCPRLSSNALEQLGARTHTHTHRHTLVYKQFVFAFDCGKVSPLLSARCSSPPRRRRRLRPHVWP